MIQSIQLENFQSHENTMLDFSPGINAIIGPSDNGKTAVLRAFYWALYNRPGGNAFVSYWTKNDKGNMTAKSYTAVTIKKSAGILKRFKTSEVNGYEIDGVQLTAIRTEVPEQVDKFFLLGKVNVQRQLDSPFLIGDTPGQAAAYLNELVSLDDIDKALSAASKKKREYTAAQKANAENIFELNQSLKKLSIVPELKNKITETTDLAETLVSNLNKIKMIQESLSEYKAKVEALKVHSRVTALRHELSELIRIKDKIEKTEKRCQTITQSLHSENNYNNIIKQADNIIHIKPDILKMEKLSGRIEQKDKTRAVLHTLLEKYSETEKILEKSGKLLKIKAKTTEFVKQKEEIQKISQKINNISVSIQQFKKYNEIIADSCIVIKEQTAALPDICPTCGKEWKHEHA